MLAKIDIFEFSDYRDFLLRLYELRKSEDGAYSLRKFSRSLGLREQGIGNVINSRYGLSRIFAEKIANGLFLSKREREYFVNLVEAKHARSPAARRSASKYALEIRSMMAGIHHLNAEQSFILDKWYIPAVLELVNDEPTKVEVASFAKRLGISQFQVSESLHILVSKEYIQQLTPSSFSRVVRSTMAQSDTPSESIRSFHKQVLAKAAVAIDSTDAQNRKSLSSVFSLDLSELPAARAELESFHSNFIRKFSLTEHATSVFSVSIQLFRLDVGTPT